MYYSRNAAMKRAKSPPAKPEAPTAWELGKDLFEPITDETPKRDIAMHSKRLLREHFRGMHDLGHPFIGGDQGDGSDVSGNIKAALRKLRPAS
jgi:hypothetical protein